MIIRIASAALLSVLLNIATAQDQKVEEEPCDRRVLNPYACMSDEEIAIKKVQEEAERKQRRIEEENQALQEQLAQKERHLKWLEAKAPSPLNCQQYHPRFNDQRFFFNFNNYTALFDQNCQGASMHKTVIMDIANFFDGKTAYGQSDLEKSCGFLRAEIRRYLRFAWALQCPWAERYSHDYPPVTSAQFKPKPQDDGFFVRWFDNTAAHAAEDDQ